MTNFITRLQELYPLWQQADLFPRFMSALLFLSPVIFTAVGIGIVNYNYVKRIKARRVREQKANQYANKTEVKTHE